MTGTYDVTAHAFFFTFMQIYFDFDNVFLQLFLDVVCAFWDLLREGEILEFPSWRTRLHRWEKTSHCNFFFLCYIYCITHFLVCLRFFGRRTRMTPFPSGVFHGGQHGPCSFVFVVVVTVMVGLYHWARTPAARLISFRPICLSHRLKPCCK
jgi:hypothetical protein